MDMKFEDFVKQVELEYLLLSKDLQTAKRENDDKHWERVKDFNELMKCLIEERYHQ